GAGSLVEAHRLEPWLIPRRAVVRHPEVRAVEMVDGGHGRDATHDEVLHQRRATAGQVVADAEGSGAGAPTGPLEGAFPFARERLQPLEHPRPGGARFVRACGRWEEKQSEDGEKGAHGTSRVRERDEAGSRLLAS